MNYSPVIHFKFPNLLQMCGKGQIEVEREMISNEEEHDFTIWSYQQTFL